MHRASAPFHVQTRELAANFVELVVRHFDMFHFVRLDARLDENHRRLDRRRRSANEDGAFVPVHLDVCSGTLLNVVHFGATFTDDHAQRQLWHVFDAFVRDFEHVSRSRHFGGVRADDANRALSRIDDDALDVAHLLDLIQLIAAVEQQVLHRLVPEREFATKSGVDFRLDFHSFVFQHIRHARASTNAHAVVELHFHQSVHALQGVRKLCFAAV